ncbi:MAG: T9SS type A sorting domain-containing protein [Flavobacteriales bacterium]|nr:T9SS type A sorting domain-containing protein [Flavobacteriales bacterium]
MAVALLPGAFMQGQSRLDLGPRRHMTALQSTAQPAHTESRGGGYCVAEADGTDLGLDERIINVNFAGIDNTSPNAPPVVPAYTYYSAVTGNVTAGMTYPISVGVSSSLAGGTSYAENQVLVWIDYNQDMDFEDAGELAFTSTIGAVTAYTGNITVPGGATVGTTRMRIRLHDTHDGSAYTNNFNDTPCGVASYGEIEDYVIQIAAGGGTPPNDECGGAVVHSLSVPGTLTMSGDNTGATVDAPTTFVIVWEAFTTTECSNIDIGYCVPGSEFTNFLVNLAVSCPDFVTGVLTGTTSPDNCTLSFAELPAGTYYIPVMVDPANTPVGAYSISVTSTACGTGYCAASATSTAAGLEKIGNVAVADINNTSTAALGYEDFTAVTGNMTAGQSYPMTVTLTDGYATDEVLIWIDFDHSLSFEPGELVYTSALGAGPHAGTIAIPGGAMAGTTRMRIRLHDTYVGPDYTNTPNATACGTSTYGQVEDYTVNIGGGGPTPPNDLCFDVTPVALAVGATVTFTGDNTNATSTDDVIPGSPLDPLDPTVWHAFTTTECSNVVVSYCATSPAFTNVWIFLTNSCPGNTYVLGAYEATTCPNNYVVSYFNLPAGTWYLPVLMDPAMAIGPYSIDVSATACASPGDYCEAGAASTQFEKISNVTFADLNNTSSSAAGFEDFTSQTASVVAGVSYPISVTIAAGYATDQVLAWIDWDHSSTFDAGELMFSSPTGIGPHTGMVAVPLTALAGTTRMRVRLHDTYVGVDYQNTPNATPCDTSTYGQVEDYTVDMIGIITGANELNASGWAVFPNPSNGDFTIRYAGVEGMVTMDVLDMTGRVVYNNRRSVSADSVLPLQLAGRLATGTYLLRLTSAERTYEQRIVVR